MFSILCKDDLIVVWWPDLVASMFNNKIFLCWTENK